MKQSYINFLKLLKDMNDADTAYHHMQDIINAPIKIDFILRWQWVQSVSAFDKLIHDLVRIGMLEIFQKKRPSTRKYETFPIDMATYENFISTDDKLINIIQKQSMFEQIIINVNKKFSYENPQNVADGLSYIWAEEHKWQKIARYLNAPEKDCRIRLNNISMRRNQIVHQGDYPDNNMEMGPQEIYAEDIIEIKKFIEHLGDAIYNLVKL